ncbi:hypothetical protein ABMA28_014821 [Loxostege sticticalis]|uniref:Reverse transcriptase domain-containing protein n=1 Tax=Loxostege sticticalis TaxID=481309 RepID=A0ABD0TCI2_LOXSC
MSISNSLYKPIFNILYINKEQRFNFIIPKTKNKLLQAKKSYTLWLDHCVVTEAAWKLIIDSKVLYDTYWSDHFPLITTCKSPGHDGLSIEHLRHAGVHLPRVLALLFNMCLVHSYLPAELMKTIVVPIIKNKTGDISDRSNYRPISLATVIARHGFKRGLSTESAILSLKHTVKYYTDRHTPVYACFLDLSKAFDLVSYDLLWDKLERAGLPRDVLDIFKCWYGGQVNSVRWADEFSEPYRMECGVRQGGLTSPNLFSLYVNELIEGLSSTRIGCHIGNVCVNNISYADDMVLLAPSVSALRKLLKVCESYAGSHGLLYNVTKSECMVFKAGKKCPKVVPTINLYNTPLKRVTQFKYLGHFVTEDLKDDVDMERERRALSIRANMLARRFARCSTAIKITLFKAALRVQYNNAFRTLLRLPRFCGASVMFAYAGVDSFGAILRKKAASLLRRGGLTSPTMFNLYMNGLIEELNRSGVGCHMRNKPVNNLSYADDMVLLSPSINGMKKLLAICEKYALSHGLTYNVIKTEFMIFKHDKTNNFNPVISLEGSNLNRVFKFKYLGHIIRDDLKDDDDMERQKRCIAAKSNMLARRFSKCSKLVKITLFRAFHAIRVQYNNAFRAMLNLPWRCSASGMFAENRVDDFFAIMRKRAASFMDRIRHSKNETILSVYESCKINICDI